MGSKCIVCRMPETQRMLHVPFCDVCHDQLADFAYVSVILVVAWAFLQYPLWVFLLQEVAILVALLWIKHTVHPHLVRLLHQEPHA